MCFTLHEKEKSNNGRAYSNVKGRLIIFHFDNEGFREAKQKQEGIWEKLSHEIAGSIASAFYVRAFNSFHPLALPLGRINISIRIGSLSKHVAGEDVNW